MQTGAYGRGRDVLSGHDDRQQLPCAHENHAGACEQAHLAEKYVSYLLLRYRAWSLAGLTVVGSDSIELLFQCRQLLANPVFLNVLPGASNSSALYTGLFGPSQQHKTYRFLSMEASKTACFGIGSDQGAPIKFEECLYSADFL